MDAFQNGGSAAGSVVAENNVAFQHMDNKSRMNDSSGRLQPPNGGGDPSHGFSKSDDGVGAAQPSAYQYNNKGYGGGFDSQNQNPAATSEQHGDFGQQKSQQYYPTEQNFEAGFGPNSAMPNGLQKSLSGTNVGSVGPSQMNATNVQRPYGNDMSQHQRFPNNLQQNTNTPTLNELLQSPGPSPKYQGHGQGEYSMGQYRQHDSSGGPVGSMPLGPTPDSYNNQQQPQQYWNNNAMRGYPGVPNASYRQQVCI